VRRPDTQNCAKASPSSGDITLGVTSPMNLDLLFVADHQATADDGFFAAAGKALAIATRFERSCKALLNLVGSG
jgi:hypothetical protein